MSQHKFLTNNDNHPTVSLVFADSTARGSATNPITGSSYTSDDIGRMCFQSDTEAFYLLQDTTPTWLTAGSAASGISDVVEDLTPQLGGDLDLNGNSIDFPTTANISDVLDEDNMASNSATKLATQQSIKAYADTKQAPPSEGAFANGDKTKLDGIEALADVTDTTNVTAAGALMDSEVTNLADVKAFDTTDYATAAQGSTADSALQDVVDDTTPTLGGNLDANAKSIENVGAIESQVNTVATTGATETLDTSLYDVHDMTMDEACTFTFSNPAPSGDNTTFMLILRGAFTPTLPASIDWSGGAAPTYTTPSVYIFTTVDAGTTWLGSQVGKAFA